jgi:thymidylate kinase
MNLIPDKFLLLDVSDDLTRERIKENLRSEDSVMHYEEEQIDSLAQKAIHEYHVHIDGVKEIF